MGSPPPCRGKEPAPCLQTHSLCPQTPATAPWASPPCPIAASPPQPSSSSTQPMLLVCTTSPRGWSCRAGPPQLTPSLVCLPTYPSCSWTCCRPPTSPVGAACHVALALPPQWALRRCWCQSMQLHANKFHISPNRGGGAGGRGWGCLHHCLPAAVQHWLTAMTARYVPAPEVNSCQHFCLHNHIHPILTLFFFPPVLAIIFKKNHFLSFDRTGLWSDYLT